MGLSTHLSAYIPDTDPEFQKHKKVLLACREADVSLPVETAAYFGEDSPELYLLDQKLKLELIKDEHYKEIEKHSHNGFEIYIDKLPKAVTRIKVYNAW